MISLQWGERTFFDLGGDSIDAMISSSVLNPGGNYLDRFLANLRGMPLTGVFRELAKIDEFRENASSVPPTHYKLDRVQDHIHIPIFEKKISQLSFLPSKLQPKWAAQLSSCADVKPIIFDSKNKSFALIGCHNGNLVCCHLESGKIQWENKQNSKATGFIISKERLILAESSGFAHIIHPENGSFTFSLKLGIGQNIFPISLRIKIGKFL